MSTNLFYLSYHNCLKKSTCYCLSIQSTDREDRSIAGGLFRPINKIPEITLGRYAQPKAEDIAKEDDLKKMKTEDLARGPSKPGSL